MGTVDVELYEFLKKCECYIDKTKAIATISFYQLDTFSHIMGEEFFDEGGFECNLCDDYVRIDLQEVFDWFGHDALDYEGIFDEYEFGKVKERSDN